jgi:multicomponent Na+:H+ antiporter subunit D
LFWLAGCSPVVMYSSCSPALAEPLEPLRLLKSVSRGRQALVMAVALCALLLGFVPLHPLGFLQIGRPDATLAGLR